MSKGKSVISVAFDLAQPIAEELRLSIWDIQYLKEGSDWYLRILADKEGGISLFDLESFNRALSEKLDENDPTERSYILEVSSPGINRPLTADWHYEALSGSLVLVNLIRPVNGEKQFVGTLMEKKGKEVTVLLEDELEMVFDLSEAAWVRLYDPFDE